MNRKDFCKTCSLACMGALFSTTLLERCSSSQIITGKISGSNLLVEVSEFQTNDQKYRKFLIIRNEKLSYPICLYRIHENEYTALFMRCTHQGTELQVFGDRLQCPAHGSEFSNQGYVQNGPADKNLRSFPVSIQKDYIYISLK